MRRKRLFVVALCVTGLIITVLAIMIGTRPKVLYKVTFLPSMDGVETCAYAINDRGQVLTTVRMAQDGTRVLLWDKDENIHQVGSFPEGYHIIAARLNNAAQVAGTVTDPNGTYSAFFWDADGSRYVLEPSGGEQNHVTALNNRGQVVGYYSATRGPRHAFIWDKTAGVQDLGTFGGIESLACGVNDLGQVVGFFSDLRNKWRAFFWDPNDGVRSLGATRFGPAATCHINNQGFVVGQFGSAEDETCVSVWTRGAGARRLRSSAGGPAEVRALNDANRFLMVADSGSWQLLGRRVFGGSGSYVWDPNEGFEPLDAHLGRTDIRGFTALDINNDRVIVGSVRLEKPAHSSYGVLVEPIADHSKR